MKAEAAPLLLDGKPVRTPGKAPLVLPTRALAEAVADEWRAQGERIDPNDHAAHQARQQCHRRRARVASRRSSTTFSPSPARTSSATARTVRAVWSRRKRSIGTPCSPGPRTRFARRSCFRQGVVHVAQPQASLDRLKAKLAGRDAFSLAALHVMTALTGSALLALAVALGRMTPEEAWEAAHVDEDWQISQWGEDAEAAQRRENRWRDFEAAARLLTPV